MRVNHDVKVRRAGGTITVWCKTHEEVLYVHQGRSDVPLPEVLEAVAKHRGTGARTVGAATLRRASDGAYQLVMEDIDLSMVVVGGSEFIIKRTEKGENFLTMTIAIDSIDFDKADVKPVRSSASGATEARYEYVLRELEEPSR